MSKSIAVSSSEFLSSMQRIVQSGPISATLSNGTQVVAQYMQACPPEYVLHFDFKEYCGSYRVTEDGEMEYRAFNLIEYSGRIQREVIDVRAILSELLGIVVSQKNVA